MKKLTLAAAVAMVAALSANAAFACTQEEAVAKMTKITQSSEYQTFVSSGKTAEDAGKITAVTTKLNEGGTLLGQQKHDEACAKYDEIIAELKIR